MTWLFRVFSAITPSPLHKNFGETRSSWTV
jgi:hypothetical protein